MSLISSIYSFFGRQAPRSLGEVRRNLQHNLSSSHWTTIATLTTSTILSISMLLVTNSAFNRNSEDPSHSAGAAGHTLATLGATHLAVTLVHMNNFLEGFVRIESPFFTASDRSFFIEACCLTGGSLIGMHACTLNCILMTPDVRFFVVLTGSISSVLYLIKVIVAFFSVSSTPSFPLPINRRPHPLPDIAFSPTPILHRG